MKRIPIVLSVITVCLSVWPTQPNAYQSRPFPDFDEDGVVGFADFLQFAGRFGAARGDEDYEHRFDLDGDGSIGFPDFLIFAGSFGKTVPRIVNMMIDLPIRALHATGDWGTNETVVGEWEAAGRVAPLIPVDYIEWLRSLHVNWIGLAVQLYYDDSMDSSVERLPSSDLDFTFSDEAVRQMIREFRGHGIEAYLTLALNDHKAAQAPRPAKRWQLGHPNPPNEVSSGNWPWGPDHSDHHRFVAEFWETYTQQAVHFARIAEDEGARLYSLGTETDVLFRTRTGDLADPEQRHWTNHFAQELKAMVKRVRDVYSGLLTYDMHYSVFLDPVYFGPGSDHLWEDLDLDVVGISAWFPLTDTDPVTPISVETAQDIYRDIFSNFFRPLANRNQGRPIMFLEYGAVDVVSAPGAPDRVDFTEYVFSDSNGNGQDDGQETQANVYQGLINTMADNPGVLNGVFFWDNWIASDELWAEWWAGRRSFSIRGKLAEDVVRSAYVLYAESSGRD